MKENLKVVDYALILLSVVAGILAVLGAFWKDLWLASTQWLLIAIVLAIYAVYFKLAK